MSLRVLLFACLLATPGQQQYRARAARAGLRHRHRKQLLPAPPAPVVFARGMDSIELDWYDSYSFAFEEMKRRLMEETGLTWAEILKRSNRAPDDASDIVDLEHAMQVVMEMRRKNCGADKAAAEEAAAQDSAEDPKPAPSGTEGDTNRASIHPQSSLIQPPPSLCPHTLPHSDAAVGGASRSAAARRLLSATAVNDPCEDDPDDALYKAEDIPWDIEVRAALNVFCLPFSLLVPAARMTRRRAVAGARAR